MLVCLSDIHFTDGSAGKHNIDADAFDLIFERITKRAEKAETEKVTLLLLGDIFDVLRSEAWFGAGVAETDKPWAIKNQNTANMTKILDGILTTMGTENAESFKHFRELAGRLESSKAKIQDLEIIYIPGNHDRELLCHPALLTKAMGFMGATLNPAATGSRHLFTDKQYGVLARHGHESDVWNFEITDKTNVGALKPDEYLRVPIGDPITTELVTRLPWAAGEIIAKKGLQNMGALKDNLQEIDNVRPLPAVLKWLMSRFAGHPKEARKVVEKAIDDTAEYFRKLDFTKDWIERHDKFFRPDEADALQTLLWLVDKINLNEVGAALKVADWARKHSHKDRNRDAAMEEFRHLAGTGIHYIVNGHTHDPKQVPINVLTDKAGNTEEQVYLNCGTLRSRHFEAEKEGFITWKQLTYCTFYNVAEVKNLKWGLKDKPGFERWTGTRKDT
jgi:UDP-2,3-diacylglucosamine pyrophosphatase LpxH